MGDRGISGDPLCIHLWCRLAGGEDLPDGNASLRESDQVKYGFEEYQGHVVNATT